MSRCGKTEQLESLVMGTLSAAHSTELEQHSRHCAVCHHELNWLKSEQVLFEHRIARHEVERLWAGFAAKRAAPARQSSFARWALAMAAAVVALVGVGSRLQSSSHLDTRSSFETSAPMSLEEMSRDLGPVRDCSELQPGTGFACGPFLPASFAMRE
jgi:hypothetical protein